MKCALQNSLTTRVLLGGDVMLGRLVKEAIHLKGIDYPLGSLRPLMQQADLVIVNLECAITDSPWIWSGAEKAFYFGASPNAALILSRNRIKLVSLANNHILDFDRRGLSDTLHYLKMQNIRYAGAGQNWVEAQTPVYIQINQQKFGMVAFCDHQSDFQARRKESGIAYLDLNEVEKTNYQLELSLDEMKKAKVDWPILSLHWGPNQASRPAKNFIALAHQAVDRGYKLLFGHSAHSFQGIEIYKGIPIIYAAGDLVDDYYVDRQLRNDHQLLIELEIVEKKIKRIVLHPIFIKNCQTLLAEKAQFDFIAKRMKTLCAEFDTPIEEQDRKLVIQLR